MNTRKVLLEELGEKRVAELEDKALLTLVEWAMLQYHEKASKNCNIPLVSGLLPYDDLKKEWANCQKALDLKGTAGEMGIYFGMFMHGWRSRTSEGFWQ